MKLKTYCLLGILLLTGCAKQPAYRSGASSNAHVYDNAIYQASTRYHVDPILIKAIINVESGFNPGVVSSSNAIGLMQLKAATAGRDAYRLQGKRGEPSTRQLKDPYTNIDLGTAYLSILQRQLAGISNSETRRYALTVSYVNGVGALLRTFSQNRQIAVQQINRLSPQQFYRHVQNNHPAPQAPRYLWKVNTAYQSLL